MAPLGGDFSAKVAQANDRIICGSSVDAVKTLPMGRILARRLRIPFFQRRYCWSEPQWATLLRDVEACGGAGHALGRLTCAVEAEGAGWASIAAFAYQHRGKVHYDAGDFDAARADFKRALFARQSTSAPDDQLESTLLAIDAAERRRAEAGAAVAS